VVAELRAHERQAVEELGQWKAHHEERKVIDASPAAITLAMLMTPAELEGVICLESGLLTREIPAGAIALEISSPNARVQAVQKRWDRLRAGLERILQQRGADMAEVLLAPVVHCAKTL
jgi:hypothetical protein